MLIGIMGFGFVGQAVAASYVNRHRVHVFDPDLTKMQLAAQMGYHAYARAEDMPQLDACFVCVPTPSTTYRQELTSDERLARFEQDHFAAYSEYIQGTEGDRDDVMDRYGVPRYIEHAGACDDRYLKAAVAAALKLTDVVICKSTAPVSAYEGMDKARVAFVPEFLTAANAVRDYLAQTHIIIGADDRQLATSVAEVFNFSVMGPFNRNSLRVVPRRAAVYGKYVHNVSLAAKLAVMNELAEFAGHLDVQWHHVTQVIEHTNAGVSHFRVPGPDGKKGFGGACFPKDLRALLTEMRIADSYGQSSQNQTLRAAATWIQQDE